ncbi:MAG: DUF5357 family protein [Microcoleaceae cyanobacterium]
MNDLQEFLSPILPPKPFHWKTFILISIIIWILSAAVETDDILQDRLAVLSLIFLITGICWRTSQPPFVISGIPLSPWICGALISLLLSQKMITLPFFPLQVFPIISGCLIYIVEFFNEKLNLRPSPPLMRPNFILVMVSHLLISCWIKFYFIIANNPNIINNTTIVKNTL